MLLALHTLHLWLQQVMHLQFTLPLKLTQPRLLWLFPEGHALPVACLLPHQRALPVACLLRKVDPNSLDHFLVLTIKQAIRYGTPHDRWPDLFFS